MAANDGRLNGSRDQPTEREGRPHPPHRWSPRPTRYAHLTGWGMRVPERIVTNADLEAVVETTDDWIRTRTGIQERRIANERETVTQMGFEAARAALDRADVLPSEIDLIIVATSTPEDIYPSSASKIQNLLGATQAGAFDLSAACSGFVYGLDMAAQAIRSGSINTALVIGSEVNSRVLDWNDRSTCVLFGDGAGAVLLEGSDQPGGFMEAVLGSDGSGAELLGIPTVGTPSLPEGRQMHKIHMDGREVFRFAVHIITESVHQVLEKADLSLADVDLIVPHQANQRILSAAARNLNVSESLFYSNVHRYGNTSAASIPIALYEAEREGRLKPNDNVIVVGFGGGLTWAAAALQWQSVQEKAPKGLAYRLSQGRRELQYITAFWRARALKTYRRLEAALRGSPAKHANLREGTPAKGKDDSSREKR
ncbi:MAG: 3-oxoacyl-ACP synthase [Candidatus Thermofonsia Clade 1 bacterium]|uniref:Beta-ketoacyl-[acyl-carrier-protein] synthase III n=1 Tax=Candidatus Thermofonsia Clade 1 bacterium TaxID=2364210 RepID=A0A2M8P1P0_9CHLR|nr:MAG: 3-oxoacyl-ACP synthase [Candidatus Thermofonsia Clade 1 bacterium]